ncbi:MAG: hypothetical protein DMF84_30015 [Acidobacteria bacterium]|nr:MAG: hypothetical protein DMF84_30015 [Acidobacteriota bacterium]
MLDDAQITIANLEHALARRQAEARPARASAPTSTTVRELRLELADARHHRRTRARECIFGTSPTPNAGRRTRGGSRALGVHVGRVGRRSPRVTMCSTSHRERERRSDGRRSIEAVESRKLLSRRALGPSRRRRLAGARIAPLR